MWLGLTGAIMPKTEGPYAGMKCGHCLRVYEIPTPRKQTHECPACGMRLSLSVSKPTIDNWNAFLLWEDRRRAELESMVEEAA